jgi:hypothetical protein
MTTKWPKHGAKPLPGTRWGESLARWDLAKKYNLFDLEMGVKLAGAGFPGLSRQRCPLAKSAGAVLSGTER